MKNYAVKLVDAAHQVEMGLYPLPTNQDELVEFLSKIETMPHTEAEQNAIRALACREAKKFLSEEDLGALDLAEIEPALEEAGPVEIQLTSENYALVYAAVQTCFDELAPQATAEESTEKFRGLIETLVAGKIEAALADWKSGLVTSAEVQALIQHAITPPQNESTAQEEAGSETQEETSEETPATVETEAPSEETPAAVEETVVEETPTNLTEVAQLREKLVAAERAGLRAQAESVALYWRLLRKPQARGKSQSEMVEQLTQRGAEALRFMLEDLQTEYEASPGSAAPSLPTVEDPTLGTETPTLETVSPETEELPTVRAEDLVTQPDMVAGELPMDEEETLYLFFPALRDRK